MQRDLTHYLMYTALGIAIACLATWAMAYSPLDCYQAIPPVTEFPPLVCDGRFDANFVFRLNSFANIFAILGFMLSFLCVILAITIRLVKQKRTPIATLFSFISLCLIWIFSIWMLDRQPYLCAFGFGGFSCNGFLENTGLYAVFLGWVFPVFALAAVPLYRWYLTKHRQA
jgi:hypothetical protein